MYEWLGLVCHILCAHLCCKIRIVSPFRTHGPDSIFEYLHVDDVNLEFLQLANLSIQ